MTQFIYHLIYLIKDKINSTDTTNQPYNIITLSDKIKDIKDGWWNYFRSRLPDGLPSDIKKQAEERMTICKSCRYLKQSRKDRYICCLCGCTFPVLTYAPGKTCPENKW